MRGERIVNGVQAPGVRAGTVRMSVEIGVAAGRHHRDAQFAKAIVEPEGPGHERGSQAALTAELDGRAHNP